MYQSYPNRCLTTPDDLNHKSKGVNPLRQQHATDSASSCEAGRYSCVQNTGAPAESSQDVQKKGSAFITSSYHWTFLRFPLCTLCGSVIPPFPPALWLRVLQCLGVPLSHQRECCAPAVLAGHADIQAVRTPRCLELTSKLCHTAKSICDLHCTHQCGLMHGSAAAHRSHACTSSGSMIPGMNMRS